MNKFDVLIHAFASKCVFLKRNEAYNPSLLEKMSKENIYTVYMWSEYLLQLLSQLRGCSDMLSSLMGRVWVTPHDDSWWKWLGVGGLKMMYDGVGMEKEGKTENMIK